MERSRRRLWSVCAAAVVAASVASLLWTDTASTQPIAPQGWRCYPAKQPKGTPKFAPVDLILSGTLQQTDSQAVKPVLYCELVNSAGSNSTIGLLPTALACFAIKDDSGTPKFPGATVGVASELLNGTLAVKKSKLFCLPAFPFNATM
jgi:hypothetical protein